MTENKQQKPGLAKRRVSEKRGHGSDTTKPSGEVKPPSGSGATHHPSSSATTSSDGKSEKEAS